MGLAGSGKTTVARGVAERLGRRFVDLDQEIIQREGMTVGEIFRTRGESHFRNLELEATRALVKERGAVVAPGAGWIMTPGVLELVQPVSYLVYLRVPAETALSRIGGDRGNRPLLDLPNPLEVLRAQIEVRGPVYEKADLVIESENLTSQQVIDIVVGRLGAV